MRTLHFEVKAKRYRISRKQRRWGRLLLPGGLVLFAALSSPSNDAPLIGMYPAFLDFGNQPTNIGTVQKVTIVNFNQSIDIRATITGSADAHDFVITENSCGKNALRPQDGCAIGVTFTPTTTKEETAQLVVLDRGAQTLGQVGLQGRGVESRRFTLDRQQIHFGQQLIKTDSSPQALKITNIGEQPLSFNQPNASTVIHDFRIQDGKCSQAPLSHLGQCVVKLVFSPQNVRPSQALFVASEHDGRVTVELIASRDGRRELATHHVVTLDGSGIQPQLATLEIERTGEGAVEIAPDAPSKTLQCPQSCTAHFPIGTRLVLRPSASAGFKFEHWIDQCPEVATGAPDNCVIHIQRDTRLTAVFTELPQPKTLTVTLKPDPNCDSPKDWQVVSQPQGIHCAPFDPKTVWVGAHGPERYATLVMAQPRIACSYSFQKNMPITLFATTPDLAATVQYSENCKIRAGEPRTCELRMDDSKTVTVTFCAPIIR